MQHKMASKLSNRETEAEAEWTEMAEVTGKYDIIT